MHGLGLIDHRVEKLPPFASIHHSIHGGWRQVDEAPYPFRVKGKGHLPLFVFLLPLLLVLDPFFMEPCPLCNLDPLFMEPCPKLFSLPFNSCPSNTHGIVSHFFLMVHLHESV